MVEKGMKCHEVDYKIYGAGAQRIEVGLETGLGILREAQGCR
jgi:hypothetical protein